MDFLKRSLIDLDEKIITYSIVVDYNKNMPGIKRTDQLIIVISLFQEYVDVLLKIFFTS